MIMRITSSIFMTAILLLTSSHAFCAEPNRLYPEGIPETGFLTLKTKNYTIPIDAASGWTIEKMLFQGQIFGLNNGHYGTVLTPKGGKWWGTGHKEGGREIVDQLKLIIDDREVPIKIGETVEGHRIELIKESIIWKFKVRTEIIVTNDHVFERTQMEALEACEISPLYYFMHCFPPITTKWISELSDGSLENGLLDSSKKMNVNKNTRWTAQYDPKNKWSILCYTPKVITGNQSASMIWDLDRYHKYYLRQNKGQAFRKGEKLDYSVIVKAVPNETGDWKSTHKAVADLKKQFPPMKAK